MVSFGNVKPSIAVKDPTDLVEVAAAYLEAVAAYRAAEEGYVAAKRDGIAADRAAKAPIPEPVDVATTPSDATLMSYNNDGPGDVESAASALAEGLGGVTVVEDAEAPWNKPPTEAPEKPAWAEEPSFDGFDWDN